MGWHDGLQIRLSRQERQQIDEVLSGGVQLVRVVIRTLVLRQMDDGGPRWRPEPGSAPRRR